MKALFALLVVLSCLLAAAGARSEGISVVHRIVLPEPRAAANGTVIRDWANVDLAPGEEPSLQHPRGTVVVAEANAFEPSPSVTEWDLASGTLVRSAPLPLPAAFADLEIVRAGGAYHVIASAGPVGAIIHARLGRSLAAGELEHIGNGERPRVATDGNVVAALWSGWASGRAEGVGADPGWYLATFEGPADRGAAVRISDSTDSTFLYGEPLAVSGGNVFVIVSDAAGVRVARFDAAGYDAGDRLLSWTPDDGRLFRSGQRVLFTDDCTFVEIWPDDHLDGDRTLLPGRQRRGRACRAFQAAGDETGRLVTTEGDVLSADLRTRRHLASPDGVVTRALWIGARPAFLVVGGAGGRASVLWGELGDSF
jgi:hypothetical protein